MREPNLEVFHTTSNKIQRVYAFTNGYGASVVRVKTDPFAELAVIRFYGPNADQFEIDVDNPVVKANPGLRPGACTVTDETQLEDILTQIEQLPPPVRIVHTVSKTLN